MPDGVTLAEVLGQLTREGALYERLPQDWVRCYACGHRCRIPPGKAGVCRVRFNEGGSLKVPWGYVGALQVDPIEKKPFFHAYPGTRALSFGMLGCDFHCPYCFVPGTLVSTSEGPTLIEELFARGQQLRELAVAAIASPGPLRAPTHRGRERRVLAVFRHAYQGSVLTLEPRFFPPVTCTPDHEFLVVKRLSSRRFSDPLFLPASQLTPDHALAVPRRLSSSSPQVVDTAALLAPFARAVGIEKRLSRGTLQLVLDLARAGLSPREIGRRIGKKVAQVRDLRRGLARALPLVEDHRGELVVKEGRVWFPRENPPGIPRRLALGVELARLLGLYCADGSVIHPDGHALPTRLVVHFEAGEESLAREAAALVEQQFGVSARLVHREKTVAVEVAGCSVATFFEALAGSTSRERRVPGLLFQAPKEVVVAFLEGYVQGDGHRAPSGSVTVKTASKALADGVTWLVLKLGVLPAFYQTKEGFLVRWYPQGRARRQFWQDEAYYYLPIRKISARTYRGPVYNLEVEGDHSYLANFVAVHNCQNWVTSQALRDPIAGAPPQEITPRELVDLTHQYRCRVVASTYNEPLITSEWAVEIFKQARAEGFTCAYISNGNATPEVLDYLRPLVDLYKVDLKSFNDKNYRRLGGVLQHVLDTIHMLKERNFWVEIVTLIVPGFNDSEEELRAIADFLVSVSPEIPWHVTAFHKDYKMTDPENTPAETLIRAARIGYDAGLHYVYAGNLPGQVGPYENTYCPSCKALLIERFGFAIRQNRLKEGTCPDCLARIPGIWD